MEYTQEQKAHFKEQFAVRRKRQLMLAIPLVALILLITLSERGSRDVFGVPHQTIGIGFFLFVACALLFSFRNWRCPACDKYLGKGIPRYCPRCGVELQ